MNPDHLVKGLSRPQFNNTGFASLYLNNAIDLSETLLTWGNNQYQINRILNKDDFLKIGLFDIWLCNEDRQPNHLNLLLNPEHDGFYFIAIDHVLVFNSNCLENGIYLINKDETILYSEYFKMLFSKKHFTKEFWLIFKQDFANYTKACQDALPEILNNIPHDWKINIDEKRNLMDVLFSEEWQRNVLNNFQTFIVLNFGPS